MDRQKDRQHRQRTTNRKASKQTDKQTNNQQAWMRMWKARPQRVGADSPAKDSTSPLALGLNHLHPFGEHRRPRRALSIPGREVTLPKAQRHESNFYEGAVGKRSVQASRDHAAYHQATNCECCPDWSRLRPGAREAHRAALAFVAGSLAGSKVNAGESTDHLQPKAFSHPCIRQAEARVRQKTRHSYSD